jgi:hypothetical protein
MNARTNNGGYIFLTALILMGIVSAGITSVVSYSAQFARTERFSVAGEQALALAEAGIEKAVYELNQSGTYAGESGTAIGPGSFTTSISTIDGNTKRITSVGSVTVGGAQTAHTVKATAAINSSVVSFQYGLQVGNGGITMGNNSQVNGSVYSNGNISGSGTITGDATAAIGTADTPDQAWETQNSGFNVGDVSARANVAMGFKPSVSATLARATLYLKKVGSPSDITVKLVTDNGGKPSKTVLASGTISASLIGPSYSFADISFSSSASLTANTQYWLIAIASVGASNYFVWGDDTNNGYSSGTGKYSANWNASSPVWSNVNADLDFRTYMEGALTSISGVTVQGNAWGHTLQNCSVGGTAKYQTISNCSVAGTKYPGSADATSVPLPISQSQIEDWENAAASGGTIAGPYTPSGTVVLGPKKIAGDLTITNGATLKLTGPLWVEGDVTFSNNATLTVDASVGNNSATIIADAPSDTSNKGKVNLQNNVTISGNGSAGSFPMVISTNTGSDAINMSNNASSVILYAPYGRIDVSNGAAANQITANQLHLNNNATINYVSGLQNTSFSNGPGGSWGIVPGTYAIVQ